MPAAQPSPPSAFWLSHWLVALVLVGVLWGLHAGTGLFAPLERRLYDAVTTASARPTSGERVALIGIDARSQAQLGRWPWPRDLLADLVQQLAAAKAAVVVLAVPLQAPQAERGLLQLRRIQDMLPAGVAAEPALAYAFSEAAQQLDGDGLLATRLGEAGQVLLPALAGTSAKGTAAPRHLRRSAVAKAEGLSVPSVPLQLPLPRLGEAAAGIGYLVPTPDVDGVVRAVPLLVNDQGALLPSLALLAAVRGLGLTARDIRVLPGQELQAGTLRIPTDAAGRARLAWAKGPAPLAQDAFVDVLGGVVPATRYAGKIVVVGLTAEDPAPQWRTPAGDMGAPEWLARSIAALLDGQTVRQPPWATAAQALAFALVAACLVLALPRWPAGLATVASGLLLAALLAVDAGLLAGAGLWVPLAAPAAVLVLAHGLLMLRRPHAAATAATAMPPAPAPEDGPPQTLGRYALESELGRGAMGVVYQGRDPHIGRVVAIKTLALGHEFEAEGLEEARQRFFREAETAGRLQHPHIVTIFDVGEQHALAYIAMEFLPGQDLLAHCRPDQLLPVEQVVSIAARVADALDYAHRQNVVHRDIKPANIMYAAETDTVKVTDFGIARITDASRTRTGMALGTPSFMSPEQLAGKKVDGRSDLYSLGVTLYQLLTGTLPFRADSLAELMYRITNDAPQDPRTHRPGLPATLAAVVLQAMAKVPERRFQRGEAFAAALRASLADAAPALPIASPPAKAGRDASPPDYDATQELSPELLDAYAKTIAIHRPRDAAPATDLIDPTRLNPDRR